MDFGLFMEFPVADGASDQEGFEQGFRLVDEAESMGVDSVWLAEYHFIVVSETTSSGRGQRTEALPEKPYKMELTRDDF